MPPVVAARSLTPSTLSSALAIPWLVYGIQSAVHTVGLDPFLGFLDGAEYSRPSLVLDLMEEFRPIIVDSLVLRLVNTKAVTGEDFQQPAEERGMVVITQEGIKKFVHHFEERVQSQVQHPATGHQVTYRRCFELQARQLARAIQEPEPQYKPFLVK